MPPSKHAPRKVTAITRRVQMLRDRKEGLTFRRIAEKYGLSQRRVREIIAEEFARLTTEKNEVAEGALQVSLQRIDALLEAVWDDALEGDLEALGAALKLIDRQARLLGLDAPTKQENSTRALVAEMPLSELYAQAQRLGLNPERLLGHSRSPEVPHTAVASCTDVQVQYPQPQENSHADRASCGTSAPDISQPGDRVGTPSRGE